MIKTGSSSVPKAKN